jgi:hypothetical protein
MPSRRPFLVVSSGQSAPRHSQMSLANGFGHGPAPLGGRGRGAAAHRRVSVHPAMAQRPNFQVWWSALVMRRCGSANAIARKFGVTDMTGLNWLNGDTCPEGWAVFRAQQWWPEDFELDGGRDA